MEKYKNKQVFNKKTGEVGFCWAVSGNDNDQIQIKNTVLHDSSRGDLFIKKDAIEDWKIINTVADLHEYPTAHVNYAMYVALRAHERIGKLGLSEN